MVRDNLYITVPSFFRCPISLDVMKSPVSLCTGVTYDRASIQRWLDSGNNTCPATMQVLPSKEFVPNRTLQRLIQIWSDSVQHRADSSESVTGRILSQNEVKDIISIAVAKNEDFSENLSKIIAFAKESDENKKFLAKFDGLFAMMIDVLSNVDDVNILKQVIRVLDLILNKIEDQEQLMNSILKRNQDCLNSRRDGKPAAERVPSRNNLDIGDHADQDHTNRRRLQDAVPLEAPSVLVPKVESGSLAKDSDKKPNGLHEKAKGSSDQTEVPRSRSFFQHDERGNAGQVGRSFSRGAAGERDWRRQSRNQKHEGASDKKELSDTRQRDEKSQDKKDDKCWNYDGFYKLEADPPQPARKRRAFREEKIPLESENADKTSVEPIKASHADRPPLGSERREDRGRNPHHSDRYEKPPTGGDRLTNRGESQRVGYPSRQRYGGGVGGDRGDHRARERYERRQEFRSDGTRGDKWKHDLFQEANRSPTPKDEEDRIAKLEALLAS